MMESRYQVVNGSQISSCHFLYTVVDTEWPQISVKEGQYITDEDYIVDENGNQVYEEVCECQEEDDARMVCNALNIMNMYQEMKL